MSNTPKKYRLLKKYESPKGTCHIGVSYTAREWQQRWFPDLKYEDFEIKDDWFEEVPEPPLSKEQERIEVVVELIYKEHGKLTLKNANGDTFTTRSEELMDFLASSKLNSLNTDNKPYTGKDSKEWKICAVRDTDGKLFYTDMLPTKGETIEAVKRLSDNRLFNAGQFNNGKTIEKFYIGWNGMEIHYTDGSGSLFLEEPYLPKPIPEKTVTDNTNVVIDEDAFKNRCNVCGDDLVYIRGKYPNTDKRPTCPTCTTERLEQISEISNKDYGKSYQTKN